MIVRVTNNVEALRQDLLAESRAAFYGGGFGGAMYESFEIERATPQELVNIAERWGIDVRAYIVDDEEEEEEESASAWDPFRW